MTTKRATAKGRNGKKAQNASEVLPPTIGSRIVWIVTAAIWTFFFVSLASFNPADPPSHTVAVHSLEITNLCGPIGAYVAYWSYYLLGIGVWVILLATGTWLGICVSGRTLDHIALRGLGVALTAITVSCFHQLLFPETGPMAGSPAGLVPYFIVSELAPRFSRFGSGLIILVALAVGLLIAADQVVFRLMSLMGRGFRAASQLRELERPGWMQRTDQKPKKKKAKARKPRPSEDSLLERLFAWFPYRIARVDQLEIAGVGRHSGVELEDGEEIEYVDEYEDGDEEEGEEGEEEYEYEDEYEDGDAEEGEEGEE